MIVYVETNFLLELAYLQEEHAACAALLADAAAGLFDMRVPAFAIAEARVARRRRAAERTELQQRLRRELRELSRSQPLAALPSQSAALVTALVDSGEAARHRLEAAIATLMSNGRVLPLDAETLADALAAEDRIGLTSPDAIVYASVLRDAAREDAAGPQGASSMQKWFLNRNTKDFASPDVYAELSARKCRMVPDFASGLAAMRQQRDSGSSEGVDGTAS